MKIAAGFDQAFDATAAQTRRRAISRLALSAILALISVPLVPIAGLAMCVLIVLTGELGMWTATNPGRMERHPNLARSLRLASGFTVSTGWVVMAAAFWSTHLTSMQLMAVSLLGAVIAYTQKSTERSLANMVACMTPPMIAIFTLPFTCGLDLAHLVGLWGMMALAVLFGLFSWSESNRSWRALSATTEALIAERETAREASRAKGEFLANMSHEIRTPLNGVVGMVDVLARSETDPERLRHLEIIRSSSASLERILSDVLDVSRLESGAVEIERRPFVLAEALDEIVFLFAARAAEKGVSLTLRVDPALHAPICSDSVRIKQVVANLVSNAVKFTAAGEVSVRADLQTGPDGPRIQVGVRDTGVGFDPADKPRIFGRFQQADGSITRRFGGAGLGLSISRQLAQLMGGELDCESSPGQGSTFTLTLPADFAALPTAAPRGSVRLASQTAPARPVSHDGAPLEVLLADDHPVNRKVVELLLAEAAVRITAVEDGQAAVEAFERQPFDLVLMDMQMPVMDGLTAVACIRAAERERGDRAMICMLTANALPEHAEAARKAGADAHLAKPIRAHDLLGMIDDLRARAAAAQDALRDAV